MLQKVQHIYDKYALIYIEHLTMSKEPNSLHDWHSIYKKTEVILFPFLFSYRISIFDSFHPLVLVHLVSCTIYFLNGTPWKNFSSS